MHTTKENKKQLIMDQETKEKIFLRIVKELEENEEKKEKFLDSFAKLVLEEYEKNNNL